MPKRKKVKVPVSTRAVIARINRKIAKDGEQLRRARVPVRIFSASPVDYYVLNQRNAITTEVRDLEGFARECGVLQPWETLS